MRYAYNFLMIDGLYKFLLVGLFLSFILSIIFTMICIKIAKRFNIMDMPNERKIHKEPIPYLGGVAIFFAFIITLGFVLKISSNFNMSYRLNGLLLGSFIIFLLGIYDDLKGANALLKFSVQIVIAVILIYFGYVINRITNPFGGSIFFPNWVSIIITLVWIVGVINAVNLLDGLDGLASGVITISAIFIFIIAIVQHNILISILSIILVGSNIGFLLFNRYPAKIFMGDTGSMFLGLIISLIAIIGNRKSAVAINFLIPIILLTIPIVDTFLAIVRRAGRKRNIFQADKEHIHHRLLSLGIPYNKVISLIYMFCIYLGLISLISLFLPKEFMFIILLVVAINILIGLYALNLLEKHIKLKGNSL